MEFDVSRRDLIPTVSMRSSERRDDSHLLDRLRLVVAGKYFARRSACVRIQGVTYGPFIANRYGEFFPAPEQTGADFAMMRSIGINAIRTYHLPPPWLLELAGVHGLDVFLDVPWPKHLCFLESTTHQAQARSAVRQAAQLGQKYARVLAYSVGNEIPANIVRWHGARHIEHFIAELADVARQADPRGLVTYANYPSTEYLDLSFLDFVTFNVYLHDHETFRRYLFRLHHLVGDRPLLLGELGMDTLRHGELAQADHLQGHLKQTMMMGAAGAFVFSWTDEWHTGGHCIQDWAFGITLQDRTPKPAYHAVREVFESRLSEHLTETPRVSVVVCSYNGGTTLEQCLRSLMALSYPDYEVIVVDDGSTDDTREILARVVGQVSNLSAQRPDRLETCPTIRVIHQPNQGLSVARNVGWHAATGSIIAYTDSDCFADPDWLTQLVYQFEHTTAAAVGGPNLTPEDGWLASCVAAAPGQPAHVLESEQVAEHIPGCNMAFRKSALEAINGFDAVFRKAGDDVDVCWRLQQAGYWITFAPGAFVWHHRRQTPHAYFKQQAGYGEAEALLRFKHPERFNSLGDGKWRGVLYGASLQGICVSEDMIYRGVFGTGLFQCIYRQGPAHWAMLPSTLEWHGVALVALLASLVWPLWGLAGVGMLALSVVLACLQAANARLLARHDGPLSRLVVAGLCYAQPLVRSWSRYRTRWFSYCPPSLPPILPARRFGRFPLFRKYREAFWSEEGVGRTELLGVFIAYLIENRWGKVIDSGWSDWDVEVHCHPWTILQISTAQEEHGENKRLIRIRYCLRASGYLRTLAVLALSAGAFAVWMQTWPVFAGALLLAITYFVGWWRGAAGGGILLGIIGNIAAELGMIHLPSEIRSQESAVRSQESEIRGQKSEANSCSLPLTSDL